MINSLVYPNFVCVDFTVKGGFVSCKVVGHFSRTVLFGQASC